VGPRVEQLAERVVGHRATRDARGAGVVEAVGGWVSEPLALVEGVDDVSSQLHAYAARRIEILRERDVPLVAACLPERRAS
jgi:hypothetical protein